MNFLWVVNIPIPSACPQLGIRPSPFGGWILGASDYISRDTNVKITFAFPYKGKSTIYYEDNKFFYCAFPSKESFHDGDYSLVVKDIISKVKPDLVHIYGTELPHSYFFSKYCNLFNIPFLITIQGLVSFIRYHCFSGLHFCVIFLPTIRNLINGDSVYSIYRLYCKRSFFEKEAIKYAKFVTGRTSWDKACLRLINNDLEYFHCDESMRESFYSSLWDYSMITPYQIFISQGANSIKGLHFALKALAIIKESYPSVRLVIGGSDFTSFSSIFNILSISCYGLYIRRLIYKLGLKDNVVFLGQLNENQVVKHLCNSHVFLSPSTIENSSNSLCEAMLLGVPSVASYVGGTQDLIENGHDGFLYQHDSHYIAASLIIDLFSSSHLCNSISMNARKAAIMRHDKTKNSDRILQIYHKILNIKY